MAPETISRKALNARIREQYPAGHELHLAFGNCRITVQANAPEIIASLTEYYGEFVAGDETAEIRITVHEGAAPAFDTPFVVKQPDPGKRKIKEEYLDLADGRIVRKRLTGMVFSFGEADHLAVGPCLENLNQIVNFINNRHIQWALCRGGLLGHAAGVVWRERGLALAGFSGAGKSTLALHVMNLGASFVSNDRLMIEKNGAGLVMSGVAKLPRINPGTILNNPSLSGLLTASERETFSSLPPGELWELEHKYDAPIDTCFGPERFVLRAEMTALAILNWSHGGGPLEVERVDPAERTDLLPAFMKSTGLFFLPDAACRMPKPDEAAYISFLERAEMIEFRGGVDFEAAAGICFRYLESGTLSP